MTAKDGSTDSGDLTLPTLLVLKIGLKIETILAPTAFLIPKIEESAMAALRRVNLMFMLKKQGMAFTLR